MTPFIDQHSGGAPSVTATCGTIGEASFEKGRHSTRYTVTMMKFGAVPRGCAERNPSCGAPVATGCAPPTCSPQETADAAGRSVTEEELKKHNTATDCWMSIGCLVYDVTKYVPLHSGGTTRVSNSCGGDGTAAFASGGHPPSYKTTMVNMLKKQVCRAQAQFAVPVVHVALYPTESCGVQSWFLDSGHSWHSNRTVRRLRTLRTLKPDARDTQIGHSGIIRTAT